jgi:hypothetical protein
MSLFMPALPDLLPDVADPPVPPVPEVEPVPPIELLPSACSTLPVTSTLWLTSFFNSPVLPESLYVEAVALDEPAPPVAAPPAVEPGAPVPLVPVEPPAGDAFVRTKSRSVALLVPDCPMAEVSEPAAVLPDSRQPVSVTV